MIAVTGAAGFLGTALIHELNQQGNKPVALMLPQSANPGLSGLRFTRSEGNILDQHYLESALEGTDIVFHCAAYISIVPGHQKELYENNVKGTENVLKACSACEVGKVVFVSTLEAMDWGKHSSIINETAGFHPENAAIEYGKTKAEASLLVLSAIEEGLDAMIAIPTGFIGPGDYCVSNMTGMIRDFALGSLPAYVEGGFDFVDVRDAASGIIAVSEKGRVGESYLLGGEYLLIEDLLDCLAELTGKKKPSLKVPLPLARFAAYFNEKQKNRGTEEGANVSSSPKFTRDSLKVLQNGPRVDCQKAKTELGYSPRSAQVSLRDTLEWLKKEGFIE